MDGRICLGSAGYIVLVHNFRINQLAERARQRRLKAINLMVASRVGHANAKVARRRPAGHPKVVAKLIMLLRALVWWPNSIPNVS